MILKYLILVLAFLTCKIIQTNSLVEFTNLKCIPIDKKFVNFEYCRIKSVNRTYKYISIKANLFQVPVNNLWVNLSVLKRLNGYKPFLYNFTFNACKFLASKNKNPLIDYFYTFINTHSNLNHSCPFNGDFILDKLTTQHANHQLVDVLPVPEGDYALFTKWTVNGIRRGDIEFYANLS